MIVEGAILPHAPLLTLPGLDGATARVTAAVRSLELGDDLDALLVLSPHGRATGLYSNGRGSLRGFGIDGPSFEVPIHDALTAELAAGWGVDVRDDELDHGVAVPLSVMASDMPVVAGTVAEDADVTTAIERGRALARALDASAARVALIASAHTGAALTPRAPLGARPEAVEADRRLVEWLTTGAGDAAAVLEDLSSAGGSCGAAPLAAFGEVFAGITKVVVHESPYGVGYLVATATRT